MKRDDPDGDGDNNKHHRPFSKTQLTTRCRIEESEDVSPDFRESMFVSLLAT